jgi:hypothetical protein
LKKIGPKFFSIIVERIFFIKEKLVYLLDTVYKIVENRCNVNPDSRKPWPLAGMSPYGGVE